MKALKMVFLLFMVTNFSCNNNDDSCSDSDGLVNFNIKVKLISTSGENLFSDNDFNVSLLKLTDANGETTSRAFSQVTENGEELIEFDALNMDSVSFIYDDVIKFYFGFHDMQMETVDCTIRVASYKAKKLNGDLVCDCTANDTLVITLDL